MLSRTRQNHRTNRQSSICHFIADFDPFLQGLTHLTKGRCSYILESIHVYSAILIPSFLCSFHPVFSFFKALSMLCLNYKIPKTRGYSSVIETKQAIKDTISIKIHYKKMLIRKHLFW